MEQQNFGSYDHQSAFEDAVNRARQIAAKIHQPTEGVGMLGPGIKRTYEDPTAYAIGAQLRAMAEQNRESPDPSFRTGVASQPSGQNMASMPNMGAPKSPNFPASLMTTTEEYKVPDKMVGLIIGKGGEQIMRIQMETGCKVQIAPDSNGLPERSCTLTGSPQAIQMCKQSIANIVEKGHNNTMNMGDTLGQTVKELMVPGTKVGLIIGKNGETIKQLQERAGVKMVMIQDSNAPTAHDKPLRISGEPSKCQKAQEMVLDLLAEKDLQMGFNNDFGPKMGGGVGNGGCMDIAVPRPAVGVVIGKGGDMIKKIQHDTGVRIQFKPDDGQGPDRMCGLIGPPDKCQQAVTMIQELLQNSNGPSGLGRGFTMGRGRGGRGRGNNMMGGMGGPSPGGRGMGVDLQDQKTFAVPADKCGLVIGKGGDTIREIIRMSGAHVELQRQPPPNPNEKLFNVRGSQQEIEAAVQLIAEKAGLPPPPPGSGSQGGTPGGPSPHVTSGYEQFGHFGHQTQPQPAAQQFANASPQSWGSTFSQYQQQSQPIQGQPAGDPGAGEKHSGNADNGAAAWATYMTYYGQHPGMSQQQPGIHATAQQPAQIQPQVSQTAAVSHPAAQSADYSSAWIDYYRSQGMHQQANMVLQQFGQPQPSTTPQQ